MGLFAKLFKRKIIGDQSDIKDLSVLQHIVLKIEKNLLLYMD